MDFEDSKYDCCLYEFSNNPDKLKEMSYVNF